MKLITAILMYLLSPAPRNPANQDIEPLAREISRSSIERGVDPVLLIVMGFQESSMRTDLVGDLGEIGMYQVHGKSKSACTREGISPLGVACGALLLDMNTRFCGSVERGLHRYMSGSCSGTPRARRKARARLRKVSRLKEKFNGGSRER